MQLYTDNFDRISNIEDHRLKELFSRPRAHWITNFDKRRNSWIVRLLRRAKGNAPVFVLYFIPNRDLGHFSAGGAENDDEYHRFVQKVASDISSHECIIIVEPDALAHAVSNGDEALIAKRMQLLHNALTILSSVCNKARIYIDVGHPRWIDSSLMYYHVSHMPANIGVSINVSNFIPIDECIEYGQALDRNFVIDTSRNGNKDYDQARDGWCNPPNRLIGADPKIFFGNCDKVPKLDAFLWIKIPGESDGTANKGRRAGAFMADYARSLIN